MKKSVQSNSKKTTKIQQAKKVEQQVIVTKDKK